MTISKLVAEWRLMGFSEAQIAKKLAGVKRGKRHRERAERGLAWRSKAAESAKASASFQHVR